MGCSGTQKLTDQISVYHVLNKRPLTCFRSSAFRQCSSNAKEISLDRKKTNLYKLGWPKRSDMGKPEQTFWLTQHRLLYQNLTGTANLKTTMDTHTKKEKATQTLKVGYQTARKHKRKGRQ